MMSDNLLPNSTHTASKLLILFNKCPPIKGMNTIAAKKNNFNSPGSVIAPRGTWIREYRDGRIKFKNRNNLS